MSMIGKKRIGLLVLSALVSIMALTGCGERGSGNSEAGMGANTVTEDGANAGANTVINGGTNTDVNMVANNGSNMDVNTVTNGGAGTDTNMATNNGANTVTNTGANTDAQTVTISLRIVDGAESGSLVLAGEHAGDVYTLGVGDIPVYLDGKPADASALQDGMMAEIAFGGMVLETCPAQLGSVQSISVYSIGTEKNPGGSLYDLCGLYLKVLDDLWDADSGLNEGAVYVSVDLSDAPGGLTEGEKSAIAWIFACAYQVQDLQLTYEELAAQGYLTEVDMGGDVPKDLGAEAAEDVPKLYHWEDGVLFSITADSWEEDEVYSLPVVKFNAEKWRSPLGAYYFYHCSAVWPEFGTWSTYSVEAQMIS